MAQGHRVALPLLALANRQFLLSVWFSVSQGPPKRQGALLLWIPRETWVSCLPVTQSSGLWRKTLQDGRAQRELGHPDNPRDLTPDHRPLRARAQLWCPQGAPCTYSASNWLGVMMSDTGTTFSRYTGRRFSGTYCAWDRAVITPEGEDSRMCTQSPPASLATRPQHSSGDIQSRGQGWGPGGRWPVWGGNAGVGCGPWPPGSSWVPPPLSFSVL